MTDAGFANYPNEWWHFSWGDQMWAKMAGERAAHYGLAPMPGG
jgi:D-alanyl-D-alanine dipeptidase